ncbi:MAG: PorT family protein [Prevotellaceae bacterium]|jgi:hypothetical protein|nr:PorT family protein [Prevotellaceae bacterium]
MDEMTLKYLFRDKLENYETPVDPADWDIVRRRLQQQKQRKTAVFWFSTSAAAAAAALFFVLHHPSVGEHSPVVPAVAVVSPLSIAVPDKMQQSAPKFAKNTSTSTRKTIASLPEQPLLDATRHEIPAKTNIPADTVQTVNTPPQIIAEAKEEKAETPIPLGMQDSLPAFPLAEEIVQPEQPKRKKWALALLANQSGGMRTANSFDFMNGFAASSAFSDASTAEAKYNETNHATATTHHIPLSFGLTFRFYFTSHWAVESGLVYTYLSSEYKYGNEYRLKQQLHYLGLPANIVYQFIGSKRFSVYVSGGGMLEKGVGANYTAITSVSQTDSRENIAGWQWSLNGQIGGSYHFSKHFSLYVEPGMRYFLPDARQPESMRTERPFNFSLGFGLRTNF